MGHQPPQAAAPHNIAQGVEVFAQRIFTLGRVLTHQQQVGLAKLPLRVADITGVNGSWLVG